MNSQVEVGDIVSEKVLEECEGFNVVEQVVQLGSEEGDTYTTTSIMSKTGDYAGEAKMMRKFLDKHGIAPEMRSEDCCVCTIGWSEKEQAWYGWSHRAYFCYGIGDRTFDGTHLIKTLEEAKESASQFAEDVS